MKIGIITLPLCTNYGGILQAYALQTVLERMGHEVVVANKSHETYSLPVWKMPYVYTKRFVNKLLGRRDGIVFLEQYLSKVRSVTEQNTARFIDKYVHILPIDSYDELSRRDDIDAYVVGSDQVWRPVYFGRNRMEDAFLRFAQDKQVKRIAYAASFGTDAWEYTPEQTTKCKALLAKFDAVSVREHSGLSLCKDYLGREAECVLDPTMLLDVQDYIRMFESAGTPKSKGSLLNYVLDEDEEKRRVLAEIAKDRKLTPFRVGSRTEDIHAPLAERIQPPLEEWLRGFYDAEFVVTDSFHACVFSILFRKQFVVVGNKKRGMSRFESLLSQFGLEDRLVDGSVEINKLKDIDYDKVHEIYRILKEKSNSFLTKSL